MGLVGMLLFSYACLRPEATSVGGLATETNPKEHRVSWDALV
jgi:hypothetical protein